MPVRVPIPVLAAAGVPYPSLLQRPPSPSPSPRPQTPSPRCAVAGRFVGSMTSLDVQLQGRKGVWWQLSQLQVRIHQIGRIWSKSRMCRDEHDTRVSLNYPVRCGCGGKAGAAVGPRPVLQHNDFYCNDCNMYRVYIECPKNSKMKHTAYLRTICN